MNIQKIIEEYIITSKSIKDCLKNGLINYSALTRKISKELKLKEKDFDAILVACRRYSDKLKKQGSYERQIKNILKNSKLEIKNKVVVIVVEKNIFFNNLVNLQKEIKTKNELLRIIEGINSITIITSEEFLQNTKELFQNKIIKISENLVEVTLKSSEKLEEVPGVMAYIYSLFGEYEINILETMSCWTDTIFIIKEQDLPQTMNILKF